ncbi:MAG TPA: NAD-dependent succinate-semialdehyde dehydrogenase [Polyangiaceae bacterium]|nr:NAD-dependent succinate-semialdehyde dehydrogenase [Polyangiaceae bacterium]
MKSTETINPATEQKLERFELHSSAQVEQALGRAQEAFRGWRRTSLEQRTVLLRSLAARLRAEEANLARHAVLEMGKPIAQAHAEVAKCARTCDYFAEHGPALLADQAAPSDAAESYVAFDPLGVVLAIMPWNFPYWQVFRAAVPALLAGNAMLLKHALSVSRCALEIEAVFQRAGAPAGLFQTLLIDHGAIPALLEDERVVAATLTGSERAGTSVARHAGGCIKKTVLELGGSDPFIVLADADLDRAVSTAVTARFQNNGQSCIAAKRFFVQASVAEAFTSRFVQAVQRLRTGNPEDADVDLGPLARADLRDELERQVRASVEAGARVLTGGKRPNHKGWFYEATVLGDVPPGAPALSEELFGPVAPVVVVRDAEEAIARANQTRFGLGANLWTRDIQLAKRLAREIESGNVFINGMTASDPRLPFGGVKKSGYGRELSAFGLREFVNVKTVWIGPQSTPMAGGGKPEQGGVE